MASAKKTNLDLYDKYYKEAMAKSRAVFDLYGKVLTHGAQWRDKS